jgi:uncharacterized membrane protein YdbT with pleckstrin-like domain
LVKAYIAWLLKVICAHFGIEGVFWNDWHWSWSSISLKILNFRHGVDNYASIAYILPLNISF